MQSDPLKTTVVAEPATYPKPAPGAAGQLFIGLVRQKRAWILLSAILGLLVFIEPLIVMRLLTTEEKAIILDPSGTYYISPVVPLHTAIEIQKNIGMLGAQCLFAQNPSGYDLQAVIEDLFVGAAQEKLVQNWEAQQAVFQEKQLHQKPELFKTTVLKAEGNFVLVKVEGQVIRTGAFEGTAIVHTQNMKAQFVLSKNQNLIKSGNYPFTICDFTYMYL